MIEIGTHPVLSDVATFSFIFTSLVTVAGWFVVARMAAARDFRKEIRNLISDVKRRAEAVEGSASDYWLTADGSARRPRAVKLKSEIQALSHEVRLLTSVGIAVSPSYLVNIRQSATGGDFEQKGRRRRAEDADRIEELAGYVHDLAAAIDVEFYKLFPPPRNGKWYRLLPLLALLTLTHDEH